MQNPVARWHICQGSINSIAFSTDGAYIATVGRDGIFFMRWLVKLLILLLWWFTLTEYDWSNAGYLRIFDYKNEQLICGGKSYYGALLCCAWRWVFMVFLCMIVTRSHLCLVDLAVVAHIPLPPSFAHSHRCPHTNESMLFLMFWLERVSILIVHEPTAWMESTF